MEENSASNSLWQHVRKARGNYLRGVESNTEMQAIPIKKITASKRNPTFREAAAELLLGGSTEISPKKSIFSVIFCNCENFHLIQ